MHWVGLSALAQPRLTKGGQPYLRLQHVVLSLPHHAEAEDEFLRVGFAGTQDAAGITEAMERRLVRRVREKAGLEAEALAESEGLGPAALHGASQEVAGVELQAGGVGEDFERATGGFFDDEGGALQGIIGAEVVAVIVATAAAQLVMRGADTFANRMRPTEIKRRVRHVHELARWDECGRNGYEAIGAERHAVVEDTALAGEIEEDVVGEIASRWGVSRRREVDGQFVAVVGQGVGNRHAERAGVAFFAVGADVGEADC